jgi:hypothetical protein
MAEPQDRGSRDGEYIDLANEQDVRFWTSELEVSSDDLREAIEAVGARAKDVRARLAGRYTRF